MATPTFSFSGTPRTQAPQQVQNDGGAVSTKAGFRQFEWQVEVKLHGSASEYWEVGFIQNMMKCSIALRYGAGPSDPAPRNSSFVVAPLPILDSKVGTAVWTENNFSFLGQSQINMPLPPGISPTVTATTARLSTGDDPGGRFPFTHPTMPGKTLQEIAVNHEFITWLAVRRHAASAGDLGAYQLLHHVVWTVERTVSISNQPSGWGYRFMRNRTAVKTSGAGRGPAAPVIAPPIANAVGRFAW